MLTSHDKSDLDTLGSEMHQLAATLYPIHRSMTGDGVRKTLEILRQNIPLEIHEVPTGTQVLDWEVPQEWNIRDAYIMDGDRKRIVDYRDSNLHVVGYSAPVSRCMRWSELREHVFSLSEHPQWIPYRTAHYQNTWGFCVTHRQLEQFQKQPEAEYEVCIEATLEDGALTYGELLIPGATEEEMLISCHICHPSLANDNLSGVAVATQLAKHLQTIERRYSYRFIFIPATIGAITWLALNDARVANIKHGLVLTVLGDAGRSTYKQSRRGDAQIDSAAAHVLHHSGSEYEIRRFEPTGYDERQFCSPGYDLPVGVLMRTPNGEYPQYHTSADNLELLKPEALADSLAKCAAIIDVLENNKTYINRKPRCEPRLDRYGLFQGFDKGKQSEPLQQAILWVLNLSDGQHTLLDIAERSGMEFRRIYEAARVLERCELLEPAGNSHLSATAGSVSRRSSTSEYCGETVS